MQAAVRQVAAAAADLRYAARLVLRDASHGDGRLAAVRKYVRLGASPRGVQALILGGKMRALWHGRDRSAPSISARWPCRPGASAAVEFRGAGRTVPPETIVAEILHTSVECAWKIGPHGRRGQPISRPAEIAQSASCVAAPGENGSPSGRSAAWPGPWAGRSTAACCAWCFITWWICPGRACWACWRWPRAAAAFGWLRSAAPPAGSRLAQLVDRRAGTAICCFRRGVPARSGALRLAGRADLPEGVGRGGASGGSRAVVVRTGAPWTASLAAVAIVLAGADGSDVRLPAVSAATAAGPRVARANVQPRPSAAAGPGEEKRPADGPAEEKPPADDPRSRSASAEPPPAESVKITNEMVDRYPEQVPEDDKVNLDGVTPIRWDEDEASGKTNPQNQRKEGEKIDPVKLDAAFLKDLEAAEKTKAEGRQRKAAAWTLR